MLSALLLIACGGDDSFEMPEPSDLFEDGRSLLPHAAAHEAGEKVVAGLSVSRVNYTEVSGFTVRESACALGYDGVPLNGGLSEEACLESEEEFARRLDDWKEQQEESHSYAPDQVRPLLRSSSSFDAELSALGTLAEGLPELMEIAAHTAVLGLPESPWDCVEDLLDTQSDLMRDIAQQQCSISTRKAEKSERDEVLRVLAQTATRAAQLKDSGQRSSSGVHPSCSAEVSHIAGLPHKARVGLSSERVYAVSVIEGETLSIRANARGGSDPRLTLYADDCGTQIGYNDDGGGGRNSFLRHTVRNSGTLYLKADFYGSGSGQADLIVDSDGSGGPSPEQLAEAQTYLNWFSTHFSGVTEEQLDNGSPDVWGEGSTRKDLVERIILGSRDSSDCILAEYTDHTAITKSMLWEDAIDACSKQIEASAEVFHKMGWPNED